MNADDVKKISALVQELRNGYSALVSQSLKTDNEFMSLTADLKKLSTLVGNNPASVESSRKTDDVLASLEVLRDDVDVISHTLNELLGNLNHSLVLVKKSGSRVGGKVAMEKVAAELLRLAKEIAAEEEALEPEDPKFAEKVRTIKQSMQTLGRLKTKKLRTFGIGMIRANDSVEDLLDALLKVVQA